MSGVTVATITRSMSFAATPAISSARRHAGSAMSVSASSSRAIRRSRMPVRSMIHSSFVSTSVESSSFVSTRSGTWQPEPRDRDRDAVRLPDHVLSAPAPTAKVSVPAHGELAVDGRLHLAAADWAAHGLHVALERQHVAGPHDALEANVVDAGEERELARVLGLREHRHRAALGERLDHLHARHDRVAGKVACAILVRDGLPRDDTLARHELEHLVDQEHRVAMRQHSLDGCLVQQRRAHAESFSRSRRAPSVRVALGGSDGQPRRLRDLVERRVERVLERDDARLGGGQLGEAARRARVASRRRRAPAPDRRPARHACPRAAAPSGARPPSAPGRRPCTC